MNRARQVRRLHRNRDMRSITKTRLLLCGGAFTLLSACHPGPVLDFGSPPPSVGGTIAGIVTTTASSIPVVNRRVSATNVRTATMYEATTGVDGGYTVQVPNGTYHIEVALEAGESFSKRPANTHIDAGDLDPHRDFVITGKQQARGR
jgi:hypothetical protein